MSNQVCYTVHFLPKYSPLNEISEIRRRSEERPTLSSSSCKSRQSFENARFSDANSALFKVDRLQPDGEISQYPGRVLTGFQTVLLDTLTEKRNVNVRSTICTSAVLSSMIGMVTKQTPLPARKQVFFD